MLNLKKYFRQWFYVELQNRFANHWKFCEGSINKFDLRLKNGVYPHIDQACQVGAMTEDNIRGTD